MHLGGILYGTALNTWRTRQMKIGFLGFGKVGHNLARYFNFLGHEEICHYSRTDTSIINVSKQVDTVSGLINYADVIFIAVSDDSINDVVSEITQSDIDLTDTFFCHTSGATSIEVLQPLREKGAKIFTFHPLQTFPDNEVEIGRMLDMHVFCEAYDKGIMPFLQSLPNKVHFIDTESKMKYHAACVFSSGYIAAVFSSAAGMLEEIGIGREDALDALRPLMSATAENMSKRDPRDIITGPIARKDYGVIKGHIDAMGEKRLGLYKELAYASAGELEGITREELRKVMEDEER